MSVNLRFFIHMARARLRLVVLKVTDCFVKSRKKNTLRLPFSYNKMPIHSCLQRHLLSLQGSRSCQWEVPASPLSVPPDLQRETHSHIIHRTSLWISGYFWDDFGSNKNSYRYSGPWCLSSHPPAFVSLSIDLSLSGLNGVSVKRLQ